MIMRLFLILFLTLFSFSGLAVQVDPTLVAMCRNSNKILGKVGAVVPIYWPWISPATPYTGVTYGLMTYSNAIVELCEFIIQLDESNGMQQLFAGKQFLNKITNQKFQEDFDFVDRTFNYAQSIYDFDSGERRKGFLESEASHREFNQYVRDAQRYINSKDKTKADIIYDNRTYERDIETISKLSAEKANVDSALNCPNASKNPKYEELYKSNKIKEAQEENEEAVADSKFFKEQLLEIGKKIFSGKPERVINFKYEVDNLVDLGVTISPETAYYYEETTKKNKNYKDSKGVPLTDKKKIKREYQIYTAEPNSELFKKFKSKYQEDWESAVKWEIFTNTSQFGLFAGANERVEKSFRNLNYECRESKLMKGVSPETNEYNKLYEKKKKNCEENLTINEQKVSNLLSYYTLRLEESLYKDKKTLSKIWNFESLYLGRNRIVDDKKGSTTWMAEKVKCSENLSIADMGLLKQKQISLDNQLREELLKTRIKRNTREEEESKKIKAVNEEYALMVEMVKNKEKQRDKERNVVQQISAPRGGIGIKK